jgi:hypothetical protein
MYLRRDEAAAARGRKAVARALCSVAPGNKLLPGALAVRLQADVVNALTSRQTIAELAALLKTGIQFTSDFHVVKRCTVAEAHGVDGVLPLVVSAKV